MAREYAAALRAKGCAVEEKVVPWRTHETVVFDILHQTAETATVEAIVRFIARQAAGHGKGRPVRSAKEERGS
jgi:hypothetical protein